MRQTGVGTEAGAYRPLSNESESNPKAPPAGVSGAVVQTRPVAAGPSGRVSTGRAGSRRPPAVTYLRHLAECRCSHTPGGPARAEAMRPAVAQSAAFTRAV